MTDLEEKWPRRWSGAERKARETVCRVRGHVPYRGRNGWENFGSGHYCSRCSAMVTPEGAFYDFEKILRQRQRDRAAAGFDDERNK